MSSAPLSRFCVVVAAVLIYTLCSAAAAPAGPSSLDNAAVICISQDLRMEVDGSGKKAKRIEETIYAVRRAGEDADALRSVVLPATHEYNPEKAEIRLWNADGDRLTRTLYDFTEYPASSRGVFVTDTRFLIYRLPTLEPGDTLRIRSETKIEPFLGCPVFTFARDWIPVENATYTAVLPEELEPSYRVWNELGDPEETIRKGTVTWVWRVGTLLPQKREILGPPAEDLLPTLSIGVNRIAWGPARTWEEIGRSYWEQARERVTAVDRAGLDARRFCDAGTPLDRMLRCVQDNVRYVAIELGEGGKIPHKSEDTLRRRYGDCKDMATLLLSLLDGREEDASMALIRTRGQAGWKVDPLPTLQFFNHAVVCVDREDGGIWLDATDEYGTTDNPRWDTQGAPALVISAAAGAYRRVQMSGPERNRSVRVVRLTENDEREWTADVRLDYTGTLAQMRNRRIEYDGNAERLVKSFMDELDLDQDDRDVDPETIRVINPAPDSLSIRFSLIVNPTVKTWDGVKRLVPCWRQEPVQMTLFKERERRTDIYWTVQTSITDSLVVEPFGYRFEDGADTTCTLSARGLECRLTRRVDDRKAVLARTVRTVDPVFPVANWPEGRKARKQMLRWCTQSLPVRVVL